MEDVIDDFFVDAESKVIICRKNSEPVILNAIEIKNIIQTYETRINELNKILNEKNKLLNQTTN